MRLRGVIGSLLVVLAVSTSACHQTSGLGATPPPQPGPHSALPAQQLPLISALDALHNAAALQGYQITVIEPTGQQYTSVDGASLVFAPPAAALGYAVYKVDPPFGDVLELSAAGEGPLSLLAADYGAGNWVIEPFDNGAAAIDLTQLVDPYSPEGYFYAAVVCPPAESGRLDMLRLDYDDLSEQFADWGLEAVADAAGITLSWNELPADGYRVLRSVLAADEAPYEVGFVAEAHSGGNSFRETVPEDGGGSWVPQNMDNGTPDETGDDFPSLAPAVDYYYRLIPVLRRKSGPQSPEASAIVPWGERRTARPTWPDTTTQTRMFGFSIDGELLTDAQRQWCANNLVGATGLRQADLEVIRAVNPDFIALNNTYAFLAGSRNHSSFNGEVYKGESGIYYYPLYYGAESDTDGVYPYIDRHEDWFLHDPASTILNQRIETWTARFWLDLDSAYSAYSGAGLLELLGETGSDGWIADSCTALNYSSSQFYLQYAVATQYQYLLPRLGSYLQPSVRDSPRTRSSRT